LRILHQNVRGLSEVLPSAGALQSAALRCGSADPLIAATYKRFKVRIEGNLGPTCTDEAILSLAKYHDAFGVPIRNMSQTTAINATHIIMQL
jgi:hypothetical protein